MKYKILNLINICIISTLLTACGGGGSDGSSTDNTALVNNFLESVDPITPLGIAIDYSEYAWSINATTLNTTFKSVYTIDDNAHIHMPSSTNNQKIKVAIIDQGFQYNHPDIVDKIIDIKYISNTILENEYHGTAVAGVIASTYLGVAPNNIELILINIDFESSTEAQLIEAFNYAKQSGAKVVNCSWGTTYDESLNYSFSETYTSTIASLKTAGISVIFASGNGDDSMDALDLDNSLNDESELADVIGVGATSVLNDVTSYSNYGSNIDIIAPGGGSSKDSLIGLLSLDLFGDDGINTSTYELLGGNYAFWQGTSFAAPTVTGVIALMLSENPNLTPDQIRQILIDTAEKVGGTNANYDINSFDTYRAYGKVNASAAIQAAVDAL